MLLVNILFMIKITIIISRVIIVTITITTTIIKIIIIVIIIFVLLLQLYDLQKILFYHISEKEDAVSFFLWSNFSVIYLANIKQMFFAKCISTRLTWRFSFFGGGVGGGGGGEVVFPFPPFQCELRMRSIYQRFRWLLTDKDFFS